MAEVSQRGRRKRYRGDIKWHDKYPEAMKCINTYFNIVKNGKYIAYSDYKHTFSICVFEFLKYMPLEQAKHKARQYLDIPF